LTRERWLLVLFQELGYGRLLGARAIEFDGKSYPISHVWHHSPIHLVGCRVDLDQRTARIHGAARTSPHSLVQEFLNRSEQHLWGFVSNGLRLRLLRDNVSLTRQTFVEFDLEGMFDGEVYADFMLLWLLGHQSRLEAVRPEDCWLETWARTAQEDGTRALDRLRRGVEHAITVLGSGLLAHPANSELRKKLRQGDLSTQDYYRQLLRLVYRLLFLFAAEDRGLLLDPAADPSAHERYRRFYSTARLRHLSARRRGTRHADLYRGVRIVMERLGSDDGCPPLALPPLGSFLWSTAALPDLGQCDLANRDLLEAIRALAFTREDSMLRPVDYKNLGSEELGSVYESLLELHPDLNVDAATFALQTASGHERKTTGSYYTPTSLVQCLLDSALDPVLETAARQPDAAAAILALKICDPACGSGHFLSAAAHRIAKRLAAIRTGDDEPSPEVTRAALRDVISHCIYGVDANPMAVELCKFSLWLEALQPGKPLTFLEHRIQCGNSLLGTTPALLSRGIPDEAFQPIEGDDKQVVSALRKRNKAERQGQMALTFAAESATAASSLAEAFACLNAIDDTSITDVHRKEHHYTRLARSPEYRTARLLADAWCAAFVWKKTHDAPEAVTHAMLHRLLTKPAQVPDTTQAEIVRLAEQYNFLHWHLAFPDVFRVPAEDEEPENKQTGWSGGFDMVLGNPPWEKFTIIETEFFAGRDKEVADTQTKASRQKVLAELKDRNQTLYEEWTTAKRLAQGSVSVIQSSGRFPLSASGELNTYLPFTELGLQICQGRGRCAIVVKSGIFASDIASDLFKHIVHSGRLISLYDFQNSTGLFPAIGSCERFSLLTFAEDQSDHREAQFAFYCDSVADVMGERSYSLSKHDLMKLSPSSGKLPMLRNAKERELLLSVVSSFGVLADDTNQINPWRVSYGSLFHMSGASDYFRTREELESQGFEYLNGTSCMTNGSVVYAPFYEGKFIQIYNHRFSSFEGVPREKRFGRKPGTHTPSLDQLRDPNYHIEPRYWISSEVAESRLNEKLDCARYFLAARRVTNVISNTRTVMACVMPGYPANDMIIALGFDANGDSSVYASRCGLFLSILNSIPFDFFARLRVVENLLKGVLFELPVPTLAVLKDATWPGAGPGSFSHQVHSRILELTYTAWDLAPFARDCGYDGPPFRWDNERRFLIRCELDAAYFHLYGIARDDVNYIMETFPIVKRKDEAQFGEYRTRRVILEVYDAMQQAIDTGAPYQSRLDPPPGPPADGLPSWRPGAPRPGNWPLHIHTPQSKQRG
jgi:hypothetical protein